MRSDERSKPDSNPCQLLVGQDRAGHWLVQENHGLLEGRFVSREAAIGFARAERHSYPGAVVVLATRLLVPDVPFDPVRPDERAGVHPGAPLRELAA